MHRYLIVALALIAGAPQGLAQARLEPLIYVSTDEPFLDHPADPSIMRTVDLKPDEALQLSAEDYPAAPRREGRMGEVAIEMRVGADDHIRDCRVTRPARRSMPAACRSQRNRAS